MAFSRDVPLEPTRVEAVSITLIKRIDRNADGTDGAVKYGASFVVRLQDQNGGEVEPVSGELLQHLTDAQKTALQNFIDSMHVKANTELL